VIDQKELAGTPQGEQPKALTVKEFAKEMGWSESTVIRAIHDGRLKTVNKAAPGIRRIPAHQIPVSEIDRLRNEAQASKGE